MYSSGHQGTFNPAVITNKEVHMVHGNINTNDETSHTTSNAKKRSLKISDYFSKQNGKPSLSGALMAVGGAFALADGIMGIVDAATAEIPQERCTNCNKVLSSPGCRAMCIGQGGCGGRCKDNNWKMVEEDDKFCYHICDWCFEKLIG